jgi:chromosome segregation ATPase
MKNVRLISLGIGLLIGGILGGVAVWSMTKNFVDRAVTAAEERFDSLLEEEKDKLQDKVDDATKLKESLETTLVETESKVDSLNTTIQNRNKQIDKLKKDYDKTLNGIDNMSHNELSDFFANRYGE